MTGNLLDYKYFLKHYKLIAIDLSKQTELENPVFFEKQFPGHIHDIPGHLGYFSRTFFT